MKGIIYIVLFCFSFCLATNAQQSPIDSAEIILQKLTQQYTAASSLTDAAINSIAALNSLIKKENYRNKISSFNNPTSSELGFNLQVEINTALKPLLEKAKHVNANKFTDIVGSLLNTPSKAGTTTKNVSPVGGVYNTLLSLVGNLAVNEKKITRTDLDSFIQNTAKYFGQYEKLNQINMQLEQNLDKLDVRLQELQLDLKEYLLDLITAADPFTQRNNLKSKSNEELYLKNLDQTIILPKIATLYTKTNAHKKDLPYFPNDAIKTAKDIVGTLQKIYNEYQKIYTSNYNDIRTILQETKTLGKTINSKKLDASLQELQTLFNDSKNADALNLRINTLTERLKVLVNTEKK